MQRNSDNDDDDRKPQASAPTWRSVQMAPSHSDALIGSSFGAAASPQKIPRPTSLVGMAAQAPSEDDVIDKASYFNAKPPAAASASAAAAKSPPKEDEKSQTNWAPTRLRPVPAFYPLERSSRLVDDDMRTVAARISEANRVLSVQAIYDNDTATAALFTAENVEMLLSLWKTARHPDSIVVELQRRKGDSLPFHRYSRYILDAAVGDFDAKEHVAKFGGGGMDPVYSKKIQRLMSTKEIKEPASERESAIIAIEIAHGLLMKDRMDARQLGLESLCLLTDPGKTGINTALIASRVVLLGTAMEGDEELTESDLMFDETPFREIREIILSLIQLRRIGDADDIFDDGMSHPDDEAYISILHNLALAVLANALDVIENEDSLNDEPEDFESKPRSRTESSTSICESFLAEASDATNREILSTLIQELGKAEQKPHNACLSAKCIGSLCRASEEARKRAKELGAKNVVQTALDVGSRTHLKLETECEKAATALSAPVTARTTTVQEEQQETDEDEQEQELEEDSDERH